MKLIVATLFALTVIGIAPLAQAQTVSTESALVSIGKITESAITVNLLPNGIAAYSFTIRLANDEVAIVEDVILPAAFNETAMVNIAPDGRSVTILASDMDNLIGSGARQVELARIVFRGTADGTSVIQFVPNQLTDDAGSGMNLASSEGELEVVSSHSQPTVVGGQDSLVVGETVATPIILNQVPSGGLKNYNITVSLRNQDKTIAPIQGVQFVAFNGNADVDVAPDGSSVSFSAADDENEVQVGDAGIVLARVVFTGQLPGTVDIQVAVDSMQMDQGGLAAVNAVNGSLSVTGLVDGPPTFHDESPAKIAQIQINNPTISIEIDDDLEELDPASIRMRVQDSEKTSEFTRSSAGALWDGLTFSVNLAQAGVTLASGDVTVTVFAFDRSGKQGSFSWTFSVQGDGTPTPPPTGGSDSIEASIAGSDCTISDTEIKSAIQMWILGQEVPGTGGKTINDPKILQLIQNWILGDTVC